MHCSFSQYILSIHTLSCERDKNFYEKHPEILRGKHNLFANWCSNLTCSILSFLKTTNENVIIQWHKICT